ncbi:MAG TPA: DUF3039 domain-containing protein [Actinomycetes bacterium]|nr:DUF3039 domain-containing protein [Actinomycetes bacterium]
MTATNDPLPPSLEPAGGGTILEERVQPAETEAGDHERFAHYVNKSKIVESAVTGSPVIALCGKVWVPNRDPQKFPVCPECQAIFESLPTGGDAG